jgi:osmotically inducible protein OsmC
MPTRSARTTWTGGLQDGTGRTELVSSGIATYEVSFPRRAADEAGGVTSPEELIAAAHSACFAMQFAALLGEAGGAGQSLDVGAEASLGPDPAGGFRITGIKLTVHGSAEGVSTEKFAELAQQAQNTCPVS